MYKEFKIDLILLCLLLLWPFQPVMGEYVWQDGRFVKSVEVPTMSVQEHYNKGMEALRDENWSEVLGNFRVIHASFFASSFAADALFYQGLAYVHLGDPDMANHYLSAYLKSTVSPRFFEETFELKFQVARAFQYGAKRHLFNQEQLPKWVSGKHDAIEIYDEIIAALRKHELVALSLEAKGQVYHKIEAFRESIEAYSSLINNFSDHQLVPQAYLEIAKVYREQMKKEPNNPDLLPLVKVHQKKYQLAYPRGLYSSELDSCISDMEEMQAEGLYKIGQFYEKMKRQQASLIYYSHALESFPKAKVTIKCKERIENLRAAGYSLVLVRLRLCNDFLYFLFVPVF